MVSPMTRNTMELTRNVTSCQKFSRTNRVAGEVLRRPMVPMVRPAVTTARMPEKWTSRSMMRPISSARRYEP